MIEQAAEIHLADGQTFRATSFEYRRPTYNGPVVLGAEGAFEDGKAIAIEAPLSAISYVVKTEATG